MTEKERTLDDFMPPAPPSPKRTLRRRALVLGAVLLVAFIAGVALLRSGLDEVLLKQQLDQMIAQLREDGRKEGRHIELSYEGIEMAGQFTDRRAIVHQPKLLLKPEGSAPGTPEKPNSLLITTPMIEIYASNSNLTSVLLSMPQPLDVASEEDPARSMLKITANAPLALRLSVKESDGVAYMHWNQSLPSEIRLTYLKEQQATGKEEETPTLVPVYQTLVVTSDKAMSDITLAQDESGLGEAVIALENVTIMPEAMPEGAIKIGRAHGNWRNMLDTNDVAAMTGTVTIDAITAPPEIIPYAPISFAFEASQQGVMPVPGTPTADDASYQLKTFQLRTKDASVDASANFAATAGELLPVGKADLAITNLPFVLGELKNLRLLDAESDPLIAAIVERVSGQPYAEVQNLEVTINRDKGGAFMIGKTTFEELFTLVLKSKLEQMGGGQPLIIGPQGPASAVPVLEADPHGSQG